MKIGMVPVNIGVASGEAMVAQAQAAEEAGFESVWTFEHVIVPLDYESKYPYNESGKMGAAPETPLVDPLIALSAIAASTKTLRLGTGVNILAQANPLLLAKQAASLDFVSGGRFMLGAGIGWLEEEFKAMGTPFERRGARFDDYVAAIKKVWSGDVVEHESPFLNWHGFKSYPLPVQQVSGTPCVPVHMGGNKGRIFQRTAALGEGWFAPSADPDELAPQLDKLKAACAAIGRDYETLEISAMWALNDGLDMVKRFEDLGVHRLVIPTLVMNANPIDAIKKVGDDIIARLAA